MVALILCLAFVGDGKFALNCTQRKSQLNFQPTKYFTQTGPALKRLSLLSAFHLHRNLRLRTCTDATIEDLAEKCSIN